jgi:hypothetical protein
LKSGKPYSSKELEAGNFKNKANLTIKFFDRDMPLALP